MKINNLFSKITLSLILLIGFTIFVHADRTANGVPGDGVLGNVLQSLGGSESIWVATSSLGISGGTGVTNAYASSTFMTYTYASSTYASTTYVNSTFAPKISPTFTGSSTFTDIRLNGGFYDSTNLLGINGYVLKSTGTSTQWVATSSIFGTYLTSAITSLNGLTGATQTFATSSDTNIGLNIVSSATTHTFTPTWIGTLADGRIASAATWNAKLGSLFDVASGTGLTIGNLFSTSTITVTGTATFSSTTSFTGTSNRFNVSSTTVATVGTLYATSSATIATSSFTGNMTISTGTYVPRVLGYASNASTTFDVFNIGDGGIATTTISGTSTIVNPTGVLLNGLMFEMWLKATTTTGLFWGSNFASSTDVQLPTQIASGTTKVIVEYRQDSNKLECMYVNKTFAN